jgi:hypothetical protein
MVYLALRVPSGAFWPTDAPSFYAFTLSPRLIARNVLEYADRAGTLAAAVTAILFLACRVRRVQFVERERDALLFAALWIPAMFALTVLLPVRSSLYALLPSTGGALAVGVAASAVSRARPDAFAKSALALLVLPVLLAPVYRTRNVPWVRLAEISEHVMTTLARETAGQHGGHIVLIDNPAERFNLDSAFGGLFPDAATLRLAGAWSGEIVTGPSGAQRPGDVTLRFSGGVLQQ